MAGRRKGLTARIARKEGVALDVIDEDTPLVAITTPLQEWSRLALIVLDRSQRIPELQNV
jgi:hypothetical protein